MGFIALEKTYDRVNGKALWQVLRMYDMGSKLLGEIKIKVYKLKVLLVSE